MVHNHVVAFVYVFFKLMQHCIVSCSLNRSSIVFTVYPIRTRFCRLNTVTKTLECLVDNSIHCQIGVSLENLKKHRWRWNPKKETWKNLYHCNEKLNIRYI